MTRATGNSPWPSSLSDYGLRDAVT
jgi:hypothetical protein